jgi:beta-glucanase (GH16 family)
MKRSFGLYAIVGVLAFGCSGGSDDEPDTADGAVEGSAGNGGSPAAAGSSANAGSMASMAGRGGSAGSAATMDAGTAPKPDAGMKDAGMKDAGMKDAATAGSGGNSGAPDATSDAGSDMMAMMDDAQRDGWKLTFQEEFNGKEGDGIDSGHWTPVNKGDGFGNNELEFYTPRSENVRQDGNGSLIIEVRKESYMGRMYTSARLESSGKFEQKYGRFEIRAKLPFGQGIWPAFWALGNDISSKSWPECGEIDIMENVGREPSTNHGSLHGPGYSGGNPLGAKYDLPGGAKLSDDFHTFAIEWEENVVRWYVDDHLYETRTPSDVPSNGHWVYDHPFFLILNVAVGGAFPGSPDGTTQFPQRMLVDYIRVYERQ